jgi:hypothetical protein
MTVKDENNPAVTPGNKDEGQTTASGTLHDAEKEKTEIAGIDAAENEEAKSGTDKEKEKKPEKLDISAYEQVTVTIDVPEGYPVDEQGLQTAKEIGAKHGASPELMQDLINAYAQRQIDGAGKISEAIDAEIQKRAHDNSEKWLAEVKADKDMGGDNFARTEADAQRAVKKFGNADLTAYLAETGEGNHPAIVRLLANVGKLLREDEVVGQGGAASSKSASEILYDNS